MVYEITAPISDDTTRALYMPIFESFITSIARGVPPISFAKREAGMIEGSILRRL